MRGSGTQTDPLVPTTWEDFVTAVGTPGAYVAFPEGGGVIDMSSRGFFEGGQAATIMFPITCAEIKGNGWKIRGLSWKKSHLFGRGTANSSCDVTIKNLHFIDFYGLSAGELFAFSEDDAFFVGCTISGIADDTHLFYAYYNVLKFTECSMTFDLRGNSSVNNQTYSSNRFVNCNIKLTGKTSEKSILEANQFSFNYLTGDITLTSTGSTTWLVQDTSTDSSYSIIDINVDFASTYLGIKNPNGTLVNTDKLIGNALSISNTSCAVTESQLHDAAYLNSIGFAIGVD